MAYTFDEAVEKIDELQGSVGYATGGVPESNNFNGYDVNDYLNVATEVIELLRKEYAPTIEMTQQQKDVFLLYKKITWFDLFLSKLNEPDDRELSTLPNLSSFDNWGLSKERENELMQAWLHPETIKVIDE